MQLIACYIIQGKFHISSHISSDEFIISYTIICILQQAPHIIMCTYVYEFHEKSLKLLKIQAFALFNHDRSHLLNIAEICGCDHSASTDQPCYVTISTIFTWLSAAP